MSSHIESSLRIKGLLDSRIGGRPDNQDSAGSADTSLGTIVVVCDGMGGCNGGAVASNIAVTTVIDDVSSAVVGESPAEVLKEAIIHANEMIYKKASETSSLNGMGTTLVAVLITKECVYASYVGDSRIYQLRGKRKVFRTFDHSYVYQALVSKGVITEEQARLSSQSNSILKALGVEKTIDLEVYALPYLKGDRLVLCTDGFWGSMPEHDLITSVCHRFDPENALEQTFTKIENIGIVEGGHHDNYSAAIIDLNTESLIRTKMDKRTKILVAILSFCLLTSLVVNVHQCTHEDQPTQESSSNQTDTTETAKVQGAVVEQNKE